MTFQATILSLTLFPLPASGAPQVGVEAQLEFSVYNQRSIRVAKCGEGWMKGKAMSTCDLPITCDFMPNLNKLGLAGHNTAHTFKIAFLY